VRLSDSSSSGINPLLEQLAVFGCAAIRIRGNVLILADNANDTLQERMNLRRQFFKLFSSLHWFFMRVHWKLSKPPVSKFYLKAVSHLESASDLVIYWIWSWIGIRPRLNSHTATLLIAKYQRQYSAETDSPTIDFIIHGRLLVRIAFHLKLSRLKYLMEVIAQLRRLPFSEIVIVVDTNSPQTAEYIRQANDATPDEVVVHNLTHPFLLTWAHRVPMRSALSEFDYFMYAEDDILITPTSVRLWHRNLPSLTKQGYLPGFLRVELNRRGALVSTDFLRKASSAEIIDVDGRPYLVAPFPYQAFWLYDRTTMEAFVASDTFENGHPPLTLSDVRASAAVGYTFRQTGETYTSKHLLPLTASGQLDPRCFAFHLPCNYGRRIIPHHSNAGIFPVDDLFDQPR
jgi:hypothetical protein